MLFFITLFTFILLLLTDNAAAAAAAASALDGGVGMFGFKGVVTLGPTAAAAAARVPGLFGSKVVVVGTLPPAVAASALDVCCALALESFCDLSSLETPILS